MVDYPKEQLQELYENLPEDLQGAVFSQRNADNLREICLRNNLKEEGQISKVAKYTGYVLLGLLSPEDFQKKLEMEAKIDEKAAKQIAIEIKGFVFVPVKDSLEAIYNIKINGEHKTSKAPSLPPRVVDSYREPIE